MLVQVVFVFTEGTIWVVNLICNLTVRLEKVLVYFETVDVQHSRLDRTNLVL